MTSTPMAPVRSLLVLATGLFAAGCAAKHVVPPEAPIPKPVMASFEDVRLTVTTFTIRGALEKDQGDLTLFRQRFLDYLASSGRFAELLDPQSSYFKRGAATERPISLELEVQIDLDHSRERTYILDLAFFYPFIGIWPLTPQWGSAMVKIQANMRDPGANALWTAKVQAEAPYSMVVYSWYRTEPIENAYKAATAQAFDRLAEDLAHHRDEIYANLGHPSGAQVAQSNGTPKPATTMPARPQLATSAVLLEARKEWIVAVMEISDTNASDRKKAVDPQLMRNLSDQLRVFVAQHGVRVIDRGSQEKAIHDLMQEAKAESYKECFDTSCQIPLGKALAASHVLRSQVTRFGSACVLNGELIDLKREVTIAAGSARADCSEEGFLTASETVTTSLLTAPTPGT